MRIILDENLPKPLKGIFPKHSATTVQEQGLAGTVNGALLARLEGVFDLFITADKNLRYQTEPQRTQTCDSWSFPQIVFRCFVRCFRASRLRLRP